MGKSALITRTWSGGASVDAKIGTENSFKSSRSINHRKRASSIELHKKYVKESGSVVTTPVYQGVRTPDSSVYFMGDSKVYRRTVDTAGTPGTYTAFATGLSNVKSGAYNRDRKKLYMPGGKTIHAINYSGTPTMMADLVGRILDQKVTNTTSVGYTVPTALDETQKITFKPDIEPYARIGLYVLTKGTGSLTVTLHDQVNNVMGTATIAASSVIAGQICYADFSSQIRLSAQPNPYEYHIHVHSSNTGNVVRTAVAGALSGADYETYADALIDNVYHPCGEFLQFTVIGNGNYVAVWEAITDAPTKTEYLPHRLKLPSEYNVLGFAEFKEYYAVSAYKSVSSDYGDEFGSNATEGLIGFWDGASKGFAWFVKIEGGAMESMYVQNGFIYGFINGVLHVTSGDTPVPVYEMPGLNDFVSTHGHTDDVYLKAPYNAMCVKDNILQLAYPMTTVNEAVIPGIYSFGKKTKDFAESISFDHIPSHGETTVRFSGANAPLSGITYIGRFGKNTFMAWQSADGSGNPVYGIDVLNNSSPVYPSGEIVYLDVDNRATYKIKDAVEAIVTYTSLPGDSTIKPFYRINGETARQYGDASDLENDTDNKQFKLKIPKQYRVIEYGFELWASTGATPLSPVVDSTALVIETNANEGL
jgi:hypothetical protein